MGLDDRSYMRERYRQRQGLKGEHTRWNDKAGRVEGAWFDNKNRGFDYQQGRFKPAVQSRQHPAQKWIFLLSALTILIPAYREAKRGGWLPDFSPAIAFPSSGTVTVDADLDPSSATSRMRVKTNKANAVVQLLDRDTDEHVISVYVRREDDVTVPVPPGTYRMKVIEGDKWHGTTDYFGPSTTFETVIPPMVFTRRQGSGINLHRTPAGNLRTIINFQNPKPLI